MGTPRLSTGPRVDGQRDSDRRARRAAHSRAFEAATERITRHLVAEIGKPGMRLLEEIADGKKRGPAEVLEQIVDVARDHKVEADAIAPVLVLAQRLGYELNTATVHRKDAALGELIGDVVVEAADVVRAVRDAGRQINSVELAEIRRQCQELRSVADSVEIAAEERFAAGAAAAGGVR